MVFGIRAQMANTNTAMTSAQNIMLGHVRLNTPNSTCRAAGAVIMSKLFMVFSQRAGAGSVCWDSCSPVYEWILTLLCRRRDWPTRSDVAEGSNLAILP